MERTVLQVKKPTIRMKANLLPITELCTVTLLGLTVKVYGYTPNLDASAGRQRNEYGDITGTQATFEASYLCLNKPYNEGLHVSP
jgi:hypothetical protein